jgi:hypothetical protein
MAPIRAIKAEVAPPPLPTWDEWRDTHLVVVENYAELSKAPWSEVRAIELFPGIRLDAEKFVIPEIWMAAGTLRNASNRIFWPAAAGIPADPELAAHRDECVRRALYALYLPGNTAKKGIKANKPSTFRSRAPAFLRLAAWQFEHRPSRDGSVFGDLTLADIVTGFFPAKAKTEKSRPAYTKMLNALVDAGQRGVISDYPRFFAAGRGRQCHSCAAGKPPAGSVLALHRHHPRAAQRRHRRATGDHPGSPRTAVRRRTSHGRPPLALTSETRTTGIVV